MSLYADNVPLYARIAAVVRQRIDNGELAIGVMLPTLETMMAEFGASRVTLRLAMDALADEGLIERRRGFGTRVVTRPPDAREVTLPMRWDELLARLEKVKREMVEVATELTPTDDELNHAADTRPSIAGQNPREARYVRMIALHRHGGRTYCHVSSWITRSIYEASHRALKTQPALLVLQRQHRNRIASVRQTLTVSLADLAVARALEVPLGSPVALIRRSVDDCNGERLYAAQIYFPASVVRIETTLLPA
jgi:GntR family transcriptional regulator